VLLGLTIAKWALLSDGLGLFCGLSAASEISEVGCRWPGQAGWTCQPSALERSSRACLRRSRRILRRLDCVGRRTGAASPSAAASSQRSPRRQRPICGRAPTGSRPPAGHSDAPSVHYRRPMRRCGLMRMGISASRTARLVRIWSVPCPGHLLLCYRLPCPQVTAYRALLLDPSEPMWCRCPSLGRYVSVGAWVARSIRLRRRRRGFPTSRLGLSVSECRAGMAAAGFRGISVTLTHEVGDGLYRAIVKATRPADAIAASTARQRRTRRRGCGSSPRLAAGTTGELDRPRAVDLVCVRVRSPSGPVAPRGVARRSSARLR
jgi:hypothetical protein